MFAKVIFAAISFFTLFQFAAAAALPDSGSGDSECNTGSPQCCNQIQDSSYPEVQVLASLLRITIDGDVLVGVNCSPISAIDCFAQPVCCEDSQFNGLISVGCTQININL